MIYGGSGGCVSCLDYRERPCRSSSYVSALFGHGRRGIEGTPLDSGFGPPGLTATSALVFPWA